MLVLRLPELAVRRQRAAAVRAALRRFVRWCLLCHARAEQRRHLAELDERMLKDIGVTPAEAADESAKRWWQA
jgi:uncharacterized protein YjiS (DUF1127 family)